MPDDILIKSLLALLVRARKVITDEPGWEDTWDRTDGAAALVEDIDNELGEVPEAGKGAYHRG